MCGAAIALLAVMFLGDVAASLGTVLVYAAAAYVGIGTLLFLRAGPHRVRVKSMSVVLLPTDADAGEQRRHAEWQRLVRMLTRADHMLRVGAISLAEHEAVWWEAYDRLEATNV